MIEDIYTEALLAAAAYADWNLIGTHEEYKIKAELIDNRGFTEAQYKTLFVGDETKGPVYEVYGGPSVGYIELGNGFSATIFKNIDITSPNYGELTVAFRGSDTLLDWLTTNLGVLAGKPSILDAINQTPHLCPRALPLTALDKQWLPARQAGVCS